MSCQRRPMRYAYREHWVGNLGFIGIAKRVGFVVEHDECSKI